MTDIITEQIIRHLENLPILKKKALLDFIKADISLSQSSNQEQHEQWRNLLLTTSVWTDSEINEINKARDYINQWKPEQFF